MTKYVGRNPDTASAIVHKEYVDTFYNSVKVDTAYVDSAAATQTPSMVTASYISSQDALRAHKTDVDAADALYIPLSQRGVANGVASIGSDGYIPSAQLPTVITDRIPQFVTGTLQFSGPHQVTTTVTKEFRAATLSISDPGYAYQVLAFASVQGSSNQAPQPLNHREGTGNYGKGVVLGPSDKVFSYGVSTGSYYNDMMDVVPYAALNETPSTLTGAINLELWLSLWPGSVNSTYTFTSTELSFYAMVLPAI